MDALTYVRFHGRPDLFITFTTNPKWQEILSHLLPCQAAKDRPDVTARVFHQKLRLMMDLILKREIFGSVVCHVYSVEWQKRGLPHAHILLWLHPKIRPADIDNIISAEIPDCTTDPDLFRVVTTQMVHGPCGELNKRSPCMQDSRCLRKYPRDYVAETQTDTDIPCTEGALLLTKEILLI